MLPRPRPFRPGRLDKLDRPIPDEVPAPVGGCKNEEDDDVVDEFGLLEVRFVFGAPALGTAVVLLIAFKNSSHVVP